MKKLLLSLSLIASFSTINAQWVAQGTNFPDGQTGVNEIKIVDANTVWALGYDGSGNGANYQVFTKTIDGGTTWNAGFIELPDALLEINNISPVNGTTAWVSALVPADALGVIYKTEDSGTSWNQQNAAGFQTSTSFINGVYFFNANVGVAYGDPIGAGANRKFEIWRTTDGGTNWTLLPAASIANPLAGEYGYNAPPVFAGGVLSFTTDHGRLIKTADQGLTWTAVQGAGGLVDFGGTNTTGSGTTLTKTFGSYDFSDANTGFLLKTVTVGDPTVTSTTRTFYTTTNGGTTWSAGAPFTGTRLIIKYIPGTTTLVATSAAAPVGTSVSSDNGTSWTDLEPTGIEQRGAAAYLNGTTGWCGGFTDQDPLITGSGIFKLNVNLATQNVAATAKFKVYPNPASSTVTIAVADVDSYNLSVTDLSGKIVMTKSLNGMENTLDISALATGAYFFNLSADNKKEVVKILKN